ncbi:uncharacterized protein LOC117625537 [Prunus dulcis]|uniref:uncharacterized protein LOC117625537 n=1 Tax=Prunus dulcis TaxID=3755 RepID=UPI0014837A1C|nr:uncharacterized protein LOC117625537 [Prunus dulcis]
MPTIVPNASTAYDGTGGLTVSYGKAPSMGEKQCKQTAPSRNFHPEIEKQIKVEVKKLLAAGFIKPIKHPTWCPTKALDKKTPFEVYSGRKPGIKHLRVFGFLCYAHVPSQQRQKLDLASTRCVFLGYGSCEKGYRLYNIASGRVVISRDVVFNEEASWNWNRQKECSISVPLIDMLTEKEKETGAASLPQAETS